MHFIKSMGLFMVIIFSLTLTACGNPAMAVVPTPTPRDAALERLFQAQQQATAAASESSAVAETSAETSTESSTETSAETSTETSAETQASAAGSTGGGDGQQIFTANGCVACHSLEPDKVLVGPSLAGVGTRAADRIAAADYTGTATSAEEYIHESIVNPNAYVVPDFVPAMPPTYEQTIPPDQLDQLVSYLGSL